MLTREFKEFREFREGSYFMRTALPKFPNFPKFPNKKVKYFTTHLLTTAIKCCIFVLEFNY